MIQQYGLGFVFLNVLALQAGLPIPAYPTLIVAGAYAAIGGDPLWALVLVGIAAALIADTGWYVAGRRFGLRILNTLCRVSLSQDSCVRQTETIFQRFGPASMLFAKFVPGFASVATALAGALRLRYWVFLVFDAIGAGLWVSVGLGLGYLFRDAISDVMDKLASLGNTARCWLFGFVARSCCRWRRRIHQAAARGPRVVNELRDLIVANKAAQSSMCVHR
jgi:membrane protein DedA with SNARE-associated domain